MSTHVRSLFVFIIVAVALGVLVGCGGNASPATPTATTPVPTAPPTAPPTSTPPSTTPPATPTPPNATGAGSAPTTFDVDMSQFTQPAGAYGRVQVDLNANDGSSTVVLGAVHPNTVFTISFCPFQKSCFQVGTIPLPDQFATAGSTNFKFPQAGVWNGIFQAVSADGSQVLYSGRATATAMEVNPPLMHFVRAAAVTGGVPGFTVGDDPLFSGRLTIDNSGNVNVQVQGAAPNAQYTIYQCNATPGAAPNCSTSSVKLNTDGSGNGSASYTYSAGMPLVYILVRNNAAQFASGFVVQ